jgi:heme A synthase
MAIEFTHRAMTSIDVLAMMALVAWAFMAFPKRHAVRRYALWSLLFLFIEALLGAGLVLFRLVAKDQSSGRIWYLSAHLTNTMLLLAALALTAWLAWIKRDRLRLASIPKLHASALALTVAVSISGTITALGDTLFPAASLGSAVRQDFSAASHILLRLRVIHPVVAVVVALYLVLLASRARPAKTANALIIAAIMQVGAGMLNLLLLAPLAMQLIHLLLADLVWISLVLLAAERAASCEVIEGAGFQDAATEPNTTGTPTLDRPNAADAYTADGRRHADSL